MTTTAQVLSPAAADPPRIRERPRPARRRTPLTLVPHARSAAYSVRFIALVVSLLVAGLVGLLVLNTVLARDAFTLHSLKTEDRVLTDREQALQREVEALRSPQSLAVQALALGMVQGGPPAFLRLADGAVLGTPLPAKAPPPAVPRVRPTP